MAVNTKAVTGRRAVSYPGGLADLQADLDAIEAAHNAGTLRALGNWSAGQNFDHCAIFMECALDGFPGAPPAPVRWLISALFKKKALQGGSPPAGFKLNKWATFLIPRDGVYFEEGLARWRRAIARVDAGEEMTQFSPIFGRLTPEQWKTLQCGHASLHMSFLVWD